MSNYISKSELFDALIYCKGLGRNSLEAVIKIINEQPTVDEKEIVRKAVERIVERLEELKCSQEDAKKDFDCAIRNSHFDKAIKICKEEGGIE